MTASWPKSLDTLYGGHELTSPSACAEMTDGKFKIQVFAAGEIVGGLQVLDAVQAGTVEMRPYRDLLLLRQGSDVRALPAPIPFGMNTRQQNAWWYHGGGLELMRELFKEYGCHRLPGRQHRPPDGRLVPQGDQDGRRPEGPEVPHRRHWPGWC